MNELSDLSLSPFTGSPSIVMVSNEFRNVRACGEILTRMQAMHF